MKDNVMLQVHIQSPLFSHSLLAIASAAFLAAAAPSHADDLPKAVVELGLKNTQLHHRDHFGISVRGEFADGNLVEVHLDSDGHVHQVESENHTGFKASDVVILIPDAVRSQPTYPTDGTFYRVELDHGDKIEIEGLTAGGQEFKAEFRSDGQVLEMKIDD